MKPLRFRMVHVMRLLVFLIFALFPLSGNDYLTVQLTQYIVYGIFAMSYSTSLGVCRVLCFGHAIFFGIGAYA